MSKLANAYVEQGSFRISSIRYSMQLFFFSSFYLSIWFHCEQCTYIHKLECNCAIYARSTKHTHTQFWNWILMEIKNIFSHVALKIDSKQKTERKLSIVHIHSIFLMCPCMYQMPCECECIYMLLQWICVNDVAADKLCWTIVVRNEEYSQ